MNNFTHAQLRILLYLCEHDPNKVIDFLQSPPSAISLRKLLKKLRLKKDPSDCAQLRVTKLKMNGCKLLVHSIKALELRKTGTLACS